MWILTPEGFFSTTQTSLDPDAIQVRARDKSHLELLMHRVCPDEKHEIADNPERDYQYRVIIPRGIFKEWMAKVVDTLDYSNFKDRAMTCSEPLGDEYMGMLHEIWFLGFKALGKNWNEYNRV